MLHSSTADPFKLALYKLMGKLEPSRRSVPQVTTTTEDWLWFQLAMVPLAPFYNLSTSNNCRQVDEEEDGGLRGLADVLLGYGERHFDGPPGQQGSKSGVWASVLLMCGQFERVCALSHSCLAYADPLVGCCSIVGKPRHRNRSRPSRNCTSISWSPTCTFTCRNI